MFKYIPTAFSNKKTLMLIFTVVCQSHCSLDFSRSCLESNKICIDINKEKANSRRIIILKLGGGGFNLNSLIH